MNFFETETLGDVYSQAVSFHGFFAMLMVVPYICYLYILFTRKTYLSMNKRMYLTTPITILLISANVSTGVSLHSMIGFQTSIEIYVMICASVAYLACEIARMVKLKRAKISIEGMEGYTRFCKTMYISLIVVHIAMVGAVHIHK